MKKNSGIKGAWKRRPLGFRLFSIFYTMIGALEYATFPLMMFLLVNVHERWVMVAAIAMYFLLPSIMRPLDGYVRSKGNVFALEELRKALRSRSADLEGREGQRTYHTLLSKVLCFRDFYLEALGLWSAFIYVVLSLVFNWFALPRALNNLYILSVPIVFAIMMYSEDRMMHISADTIREDIPITEDFIRLVWLEREELGKLDVPALREEFDRKKRESESAMDRGVNKISLISFSEYALVFLLFLALYSMTRYSLELSLSLFVSLPVFIEGVKAVSDLSRHIMRAGALKRSITRFVEEEEA